MNKNITINVNTGIETEAIGRIIDDIENDINTDNLLLDSVSNNHTDIGKISKLFRNILNPNNNPNKNHDHEYIELNVQSPHDTITNKNSLVKISVSDIDELDNFVESGLKIKPSQNNHSQIFEKSTLASTSPVPLSITSTLVKTRSKKNNNIDTSHTSYGLTDAFRDIL